jgi:hypothetical protein
MNETYNFSKQKKPEPLIPAISPPKCISSAGGYGVGKLWSVTDYQTKWEYKLMKYILKS